MKKENKAPTPPAPDQIESQNIETGMQVSKSDGLSMSVMSINDIDSLEGAEAAAIDLMSNYWSPENPGETKRVIFDRIDVSPVLSQDTGEVLDLECAYFFVKENGDVKQIRNGSKRLVGAIQAYNVQRGTPLEIKYLGKKQNRMNAFRSDNWSLKPLIINLPVQK